LTLPGTSDYKLHKVLLDFCISLAIPLLRKPQHPLVIKNVLLSPKFQLGLSFGLNSLFLKYSRSDETQAEFGAVQLMRRAGYNPQGLVSFMQTLGNRGGGFFSDHPSPSNRIGRIQQEIAPKGGRGSFRRG